MVPTFYKLHYLVNSKKKGRNKLEGSEEIDTVKGQCGKGRGRHMKRGKQRPLAADLGKEILEW